MSLAFDEQDRARDLTHRPDDLFVARVADEDHEVAVSSESARLHVHLRDERARRVDRTEPPGGCILLHRGRHTVRGEHDGLALRHVLLVVQEDRTQRFQVAHHVDVVDDLLPDVDRCAVELQRPLHRLDCPLDASAIPAGRSEEELPHHLQRRV
jgi:hypothetical protein